VNAAIVAGALCSAFVSPSLAFASGVAFLVSESADFAIYTPLRESNWIGAVVASNVVGVLVDSWLFLTLAFHSLHFFWGQVVGKLWVTALAVVILAPVRKPFLRWARAGAPSAATLLGREVTPTA
jgi:uncharacterized PurR-regulated membrane protein YhhQ (DUF165 family)